MGNLFSINRWYQWWYPQAAVEQTGSASPASTEASNEHNEQAPLRARTASGPLQGLERRGEVAAAPPIAVSALPQELWIEIASRTSPQARQTMRAVSKTLKAAAEAAAVTQPPVKLTVRSSDELRALRDTEGYAALESLTLEGCFTDEDLAALPAALKALDLSRCGRQITAAGIAHLNELPLAELNVRNNRIDDEGARLLAAHPTLTTLNVASNGIGDAGAQALAANTRLESLDISFSEIGSKGVQALADNATLKTLNISSNHIGDAGALALAANTTLTALSTSCNQISDAGAQALAGSESLTSLDISGNHFGDAGVQAIAANTRLRRLDISDNRISEAGVQAVAANTTLTELRIADCEIGTAGAQALAANTRLVSLVGCGRQRDRRGGRAGLGPPCHAQAAESGEEPDRRRRGGSLCR